MLVDEYDKPLLDMIENPEAVAHNRAVLKGFYSVLKKADAQLHTVFITGVTKFSKVSIFSDLNNLSDVSLSADYSGICGVSEMELVESLGPELDVLVRARRMGRGACLDALRARYDGYCFHPEGPLVVDRPESGSGSFDSEAVTRGFTIRSVCSGH